MSDNATPENASPESANPEEKRKFTRIAYECRGFFTSLGQAFPVTIRDLSLKGVLAETKRPVGITPNTRGNLVICISDTDNISMDVKVVGVHALKLHMSCQRINLDSLNALKRVFQLNLKDQELLRRNLEELNR